MDRSIIVDRLGILSPPSRATLLYALARFWAFRAPQLTYEIEMAVGHRIVDAHIVPGGELGIVLTLDNGSQVRLLQAPASTGGGPERSALPEAPA